MPISYTIHDDGHFIHAVASDAVSDEEFIEYEVDHAIDERIQSPVAELFVIQRGALRSVTRDALQEILDRRKGQPRPPSPHRCAIVVPYDDSASWDLAKLYEEMAVLHAPESIIVFGEERIARIWLGVEVA